MFPNDDIENEELIHKLIREEIEVYQLLENDIPITISEINQIINNFKTKKKLQVLIN
jgi:predicted transcriptional regulator